MLIAAGVCVAALITAFAFLAIAFVVNRKGVAASVEAQFSILTRRKAQIDVVSICQAVDNYTVINSGQPPASLEVLVTPDENGKTLLRDCTAIPIDPWGNPYGYEPPSADRGYRVFSLGKDGRLGGKGDDADIDNFTPPSDRTR
jgi:hypothetical protein